MKKILTMELIDQYKDYLYEEEKAKSTIEKYIRDIKKFYSFLPKEKTIEKKIVIEYKEFLKEHYKISSANSMIVAINRFFEYAVWQECKVHQFKIQKALFCKKETYLTKEEYETLIKTAKVIGDYQLYFIMQTICSTGIRVSELQYITVQSLKKGYAEICNKGKSRIILLPKPLIKVLKTYCASFAISSGSVFVSKSNLPISRITIWKKMKNLCNIAEIEKEKVFPHNLRHLFAFTFYRLEKNLLRLAEVLGHSSIETTRIYTTTTGEEHQRLISRLGLVDDYAGNWCII